MGFEIKIIEFLQGGRTPFFDMSFQVISLLGSYMGVILALGIFLLFKPKLALWYSGTYAVTFLLYNIIKESVERVRPYNATDTIISIGDKVTSFSMPSGHAVTACMTAIFMGVFLFSMYKGKFARTIVTLSMIMYVFLVGLSRMYLGKHYLTDVLAGILLASAISVIFILIMKAYNKRRAKYEDQNRDTQPRGD